MTTKEPGPVSGELGFPMAGSGKLSCVEVRPGVPGLSKNFDLAGRDRRRTG